MNYLIIILSTTILLSCSNTKEVDENTAVKTEETTENLYRLNVSFYSIGSGIDANAKDEYLKFIQVFETKNKLKIVYETTSWGREGEIDFCFKLAELTKNDQIKFIEESKTNLKNAKWVHFTENTTCKSR